MTLFDELPELLALVALLSLIAYAMLAGADFGGGVWDLLASGPRVAEQRAAISQAMGPVWEANHVWLIFVIVLLFTAFPSAFAVLCVALFGPFHLVLAGIALRGAAFVFRSHNEGGAPGMWGSVFGSSSAFTPFLLGASLAAVSAGRIRFQNGEVVSPAAAWLSPFALGCGALALALCAYLAAIYLILETSGALREDFLRRAAVSWWVAGALSVAVIPLALLDAPRLATELLGARAAPVVAMGAVLAPISGLALWRGHYQLSRAAAVGQVTLLLVGWGLAQWPHIIYPDVSLHVAAAPAPTLRFILATVPIGLALLLPSLWFLFRVFKSNRPAIHPDGRPA